MSAQTLSARRFTYLTLIVSALAVPAGGPARAQIPAQDHAGQYAQADIVYGLSVYSAQCSTCHGAEGASVGNVNLRTGRFRRATTDQELSRLIASGIPDAGMPPFRLNSAEIAGVIAYLRNMNAVDPSSAKLGDASRGRSIVEGKGGCLKCHAVYDAGSLVGPDLSEIGANRPPSALQNHLTDPSGSMMPINRPVRAVTRRGEVISGRRLNEDTYTVQVIDSKERLVSLLKDDLRELQILTTSPMPSYKDQLTAEELTDVVAYLLSLKGS